MLKEELTLTENYKFEDGKLYRKSVSGWHHEDDEKCVRNVGIYKVFAYRINAAVPYTVYHVANTETGEVLAGEAQHWWSGNNHLGELVESLRTELETRD